ncbi:MAG: hypothetical protein JO169_02905, partial [Solirubrobacterales bacterium]|nr:hypothetical protein [Solirubrobacterales bacterium]
MSTDSIRQVPLALALGTIAVASGWAVSQHSKTIELLPLILAVPALLLVL